MVGRERRKSGKRGDYRMNRKHAFLNQTEAVRRSLQKPDRLTGQEMVSAPNSLALWGILFFILVTSSLKKKIYPTCY